MDEVGERVATEDELRHYGTPRHSGRYPWGSGEDPHQRGNRDLLAQIQHLKSQGMTEPQIARGLGMSSTTELRAKIGIARAAKRQADADQAYRLHSKGMSNVAIGQQMGVNESSVRALLNPALKAQRSVLETVSGRLKSEVDAGGYLDIGKGTENHLGISGTRLATAVAMLKEQGYVVRNIQVPQQFGKGKTTVKVLGPPGSEKVFIDGTKIKTIAAYSNDGGHSMVAIKPPVSISSSRIAVRHAGEGGENADGVIYVRPGVPDISLGKARYAQVRIAVDSTHYMKGMAVYKHDLPHGVDLLFHTNKPNTGNKMDALKAAKDEKEPWTTMIRHQREYIGKDGKLHQSVMNIVNEEGNWREWRPSLSSQILSKQPVALAQRQLGYALGDKKAALDDILRLTNPVIKHKLLVTFGDEADAAAVHLKAAALPRQGTHVILPLTSLKEHEIYAPKYHNGEKVALIRHPHGGIFEIPELTVNNRNVEGRRSITSSALDAVGIHPNTAKRLSGADFDGDAVLVIPNSHRALRTSAPLAELQHFDPQIAYPKYPGMKVLSERAKQQKMGDVSNLITDMTIKGARPEEIAQAVRHSMVVIDAVKHELDHKQSYIDNGIAALKEKYQGKSPKTGKLQGASTIVSRASSEKRVPEFRPRPFRSGGPINPRTGEKVRELTGRTTIDRKGQIVPKTVRSTKLAEVTDARKLSSGTPIEEVYAAHSNAMKALGNQARLESLKTGGLNYSPSAAKTYAQEVARLDAALNVARKNAPLERQAQLIANSIVSGTDQGNRHTMDPDELKKVQARALQTARNRVGAHKQQIEISDREWQAIQSGAISTHKLRQILDHANLDKVKELATPRQATVATKAVLAVAKARLSAGYTQAEVAASLGIPVSTLNTALLREGK